jgi:hypothetical protein
MKADLKKAALAALEKDAQAKLRKARLSHIRVKAVQIGTVVKLKWKASSDEESAKISAALA